jgi:hypothetical protein
VRNFVLRHPEILEHPQINKHLPRQKLELLGVELGLVHKDESVKAEHPDALFRNGRTYFVVEVKSEIKSEPDLKIRAAKHFEALKHTLETTGKPFDNIIPVVVTGDALIGCIRSHYYNSLRVPIGLSEKIEYHHPCLGK